MPTRMGIGGIGFFRFASKSPSAASRRFPCAELILYPSMVQGAEAAEQLTSGILFFDMTQMVDVIIIGRGGGSAEDLWSFNDEMLARAIAACSVPVISAVGHESDFTICDFVADLRAPTPSAAAELALPDGEALLSWLAESRGRLQTAAMKIVAAERRMLERTARSPVLRHPERLTEAFRMTLSRTEEALDRATTDAIARRHETLLRNCGRLEALSPLSVLSRGYAVVGRDGQTLTRAETVTEGDSLNIRFADGVVHAVATGKDRIG